jgi:hypothetical protein
MRNSARPPRSPIGNCSCWPAPPVEA